MPNYPLYCVKANISRREMINCLKQKFPKYEKMTQSIVCNPDDYGAQLIPEAEELLVKTFGMHEGLSLKKQKRYNRKKNNRLYVRLDDAMYARLEAVYQRSSYASKQDLIEAALSDFCNRYGGGQ